MVRDWESENWQTEIFSREYSGEWKQWGGGNGAL